MNQLETNLTLWAICSIILFELLFIIILCRFCFNRLKPKKFYLKREEYEYLKDNYNGTQSKFQSTILRPPPHSDELAMVGTIRQHDPPKLYKNVLQNLAYQNDDDDRRIWSIDRPLTQHWFELQPPPSFTNTTQLPPVDYEFHSYPTHDYLHTQSSLPRPIIIDYHHYRHESDDDDDGMERFRLQSIRQSELLHPQAQRIDTSTESHAFNYSNTVPKSILKSSANPTPPLDLFSIPSIRTEYSQRSSNSEDSSYPSVKTIDTERRIPVQSILSTATPFLLKQHMHFADVDQLSETDWQVPREFSSVLSNSPRTSSTSIAGRTTRRSWQHDRNFTQSRDLSEDDITQQQALEY